MLTYQDLLAVGEDEKARMDFIWRSINEHEGSKAYQVAVDAELYFKGENPTINRYEKSYMTCKAAPIRICIRQITRSRPRFLALTCGKRFPTFSEMA